MTYDRAMKNNVSLKLTISKYANIAPTEAIKKYKIAIRFSVIPLKNK